MLKLKVLSYWNLNFAKGVGWLYKFGLKVLSYWNLNEGIDLTISSKIELKVLSYWNLNISNLFKTYTFPVS